MLVRLFGSNFRCLKDSFELSMVAADLKREEDRKRGIIEVPIKGMSEPLRLLRAVALYGPNASGKSTILTAARALQWIATHSSQRSEPNAPIPPYEPFLLAAETKKESVHLGCDVTFEESFLRYEISFTADFIIRETLIRLDGENEAVLIDRNECDPIQGELISGSDANRLYVKQMQPNVSVLSKLGHHGPRQGVESAYPYYKAIRDSTRFEDYSHTALPGVAFGITNERFADDSEYREWIMSHLIRGADVGICNAHTRREPNNLPDEIRSQLEKSLNGFGLPTSRVVVSFEHYGSSNSEIEFSDESAGTRKLLHIADDWWSLGNESTTLFADELTASLHPRLLDRIVRAINDPPVSPVQSQLIFATHETMLLEGQDGQPPALRRDQVYFTRKNAKGACELYSLTEFKDGARHVHNIRKRYLSGLYGAIPSAEKVSL